VPETGGVNDGNLPFHVGTVAIGGDSPDEFSISSQAVAASSDTT
jgi:hypothetical protein